MRTDDGKLRACPTCNTPVPKTSGLGLRDYRFINQHLPGKVGMMDVDGVLERNGYILILETKPPGASIPLGQRITFKAFVKTGKVTVWVAWADNKAETVEVGAMDARGEVPFVEKMPLRKFIQRITEWYAAADKGEL